MFNNLIESTSHRGEIKRRGSFLLFTTAVYGLLFVVAGVASIYAYEARLDQQNLELITMMHLTELPTPPVERTPEPAGPRDAGDSNPNRQDYYVRQIRMADTNQPDVVPDKVSAERNPFLPLPKQGVVVIGDHDSNPGGARREGSDDGSDSGGTSRRIVVNIEQPPPPMEVRKPVPAVVRKNVINGDAILLPKPPYPQIARTARAQGMVKVQVLIDETGKVISAQVASGHPLLIEAARRAAYQAKFSPTLIGDQPVKVSGLITYNFVLTQ